MLKEQMNAAVPANEWSSEKQVGMGAVVMGIHKAARQEAQLAPFDESRDLGWQFGFQESCGVSGLAKACLKQLVVSLMDVVVRHLR